MVYTHTSTSIPYLSTSAQVQLPYFSSKGQDLHLLCSISRSTVHPQITICLQGIIKRQHKAHFIFPIPKLCHGQQENELDLHLLPQLRKSRSQDVPVLEGLALTAGPGGGSTTKWPCRKGMDPAGASPVGGIIGLSQLESHQAAAQGVGGGRGVRAWWPEPWEACPRRRLGRWRVEERRPEGRRAGRRNAWDGGAVRRGGALT